MQIGLLSTFNNELLPHYIKKLQKKNLLIFILFFLNKAQNLFERIKKFFLKEQEDILKNLNYMI